ncbi:hypothetical protein B0H16DRAFT_1837467 [Mycena metata]|uniref:Uncharacterized protein n=1 Tax=Mycena metata TaxID=1033252 RepID=A0AAD7IXD1_9AGAR|nr:hypothetical protein B0H16DRAFT_1837467 [Mycena metata]
MSSFNLHQRLYNGYKPLIGHPHDFHGYSVDTHGFGEDLDVEITELPSERRERTEYRLPPLRHSPTPPPYPFLDLSTVPTQTPVRPDALTMLPPATPARVALHDLNFFPQQGFDRRGPEYLPPDDFQLPRLMDDQGRAWSGETGTELKQKRKGKKAKKRQENFDAEAGKGGRYNGDDYIGFARAWEKVLTTAPAQKTFRHHGMTASTMQNKCESLVGFKKTPGDPKYKTLAKLIGNNTSEAITIGALLERMEIQYDEAKDKSDEAKAVIKKKNDEDREGGEAIRQASMRTMCRKRSLSPASDDTDDNATETDKDEPVKPSTPSSSLSTIDDDDKKKKNTDDADDNKKKKKAEKKSSVKRRRLSARRSILGQDALFQLLKEDNERRAEHEKEVSASLREYVKDSREQRGEFSSILRDLVASAARN